jgi:uncharacterized C2H2 Zn-finger protein
MDGYPCTCGGENSNCFKCYGTGLVQSSSLLPRSDGRVHTQPMSSESKNTNPSKWPEKKVRPSRFSRPSTNSFLPVACSLCGLLFGSGTEYLSHILAVHKKTSAINKNTIKSAPKKSNNLKSENLFTCSNCDAQVKDLEKHYERAHSLNAQARREKEANKKTEKQRLNQPLQAAEQRLRKLRQSFPESMLCGVCLNDFKSRADLAEHLDLSHGLKVVLRNHLPSVFTLKNASIKTKTLKKFSPQQKNLKADTTHESTINQNIQNDYERKMDATYGLGGFARDQGRFGSSASYDGMDDESSP